MLEVPEYFLVKTYVNQKYGLKNLNDRIYFFIQSIVPN